jgi:hypothetical protein
VGSSTLSEYGPGAARIELFGDEVEQIRAFSPFRNARFPSMRPWYPARERVDDLADPEKALSVEPGSRIAYRCSSAPDIVWQPDDVKRLWGRKAWSATTSTARHDSSRSRSQPHVFEAQRPAIARGLARPERLAGMLRQTAGGRDFPAPR